MASPIPTPNQIDRFVGLSVAVVALLTPYASRAAAIPLRGTEWFTDYTPSVIAVIVAIIANGVHGGTLYALVMSSTYRRAAVWLGVLASLAYVAVIHFAYFDLRSSSTAGIGILTIPIYAALVAAAVWLGVGVVFGRKHAG